MSTSISNGSTFSRPMFIDGWTETRQTTTITHQVINGGLDLTVNPANLRSGSFTVVFDNEADAVACMNMHAGTAVCTLGDTSRPSVYMTYVTYGSIERTLDDGRKWWRVTIPYQEVAS